eukprot:TRINITY_DN5020_c0_g2_i1.p1 TRINITY_DN5020_c0_g2~~TRINITY_DN5020_c0_g2_i1.p1  ORF type:complete len:229 (+),score=133.18 TRINITY_DN5020_c0_g2_i1:64-750(+)
MTEVAPALPSEYEADLGNLMLSNTTQPAKHTEDALQAAAEEHVQALVGQLFHLPSVKVQDTRMAELPAPTFVIPREKPAPKEKDTTKWEEFRKEKGIKKRKKMKREFDEERGEWMAAYGAKKRKIEKKEDWIREVPDNYVPKVEGGDAFLDAAMERKERISKQKKREEANKRRARSNHADVLDTTASRLATASMGKFDMNKGAVKGKNTSKKASAGRAKSKVAQRNRK